MGVALRSSTCERTMDALQVGVTDADSPKRYRFGARVESAKADAKRCACARFCASFDLALDPSLALVAIERKRRASERMDARDTRRRRTS